MEKDFKKFNDSKMAAFQILDFFISSLETPEWGLIDERTGKKISISNHAKLVVLDSAKNRLAIPIANNWGIKEVKP